MIIPTKLRDHYLTKAEESLIKDQNPEGVWDPASKVPSAQKLIEENKKTKAQQLYLEENIEKINEKRKIKTTIITILIIVLISSMSLSSLMHTFFTGLFYPIMLGIIIVGLAYRVPNVKKVKKDILKLEVARRNNYLYAPHEDTTKYYDYKQVFPQAFRRGSQDQNIEDVFWGKIKKNNKDYHFTTGVFNYKEMEGSGKHRRLVTYLDHYFAIKLHKKINTRFSLIPNKTLFGNLFSKKQLTTESKKFNDTYKIITRDEKEEQELEIIRVLTPRVQEELLNFNEQTQKTNTLTRERKASGTIVIIDKETILFYIPGPLIKNMKTTFKKDMKILDEDINEINDELNKLINISSEISKYIN